MMQGNIHLLYYTKTQNGTVPFPVSRYSPFHRQNGKKKKNLNIPIGRKRKRPSSSSFIAFSETLNSKSTQNCFLSRVFWKSCSLNRPIVLSINDCLNVVVTPLYEGD